MAKTRTPGITVLADEQIRDSRRRDRNDRNRGTAAVSTAATARFLPLD